MTKLEYLDFVAGELYDRFSVGSLSEFMYTLYDQLDNVKVEKKESMEVGVSLSNMLGKDSRTNVYESSINQLKNLIESAQSENNVSDVAEYFEKNSSTLKDICNCLGSLPNCEKLFNSSKKFNTCIYHRDQARAALIRYMATRDMYSGKGNLNQRVESLVKETGYDRSLVTEVFFITYVNQIRNTVKNLFKNS